MILNDKNKRRNSNNSNKSYDMNEIMREMPTSYDMIDVPDSFPRSAMSLNFMAVWILAHPIYEPSIGIDEVEDIPEPDRSKLIEMMGNANDLRRFIDKGEFRFPRKALEKGDQIEIGDTLKPWSTYSFSVVAVFCNLLQLAALLAAAGNSGFDGDKPNSGMKGSYQLTTLIFMDAVVTMKALNDWFENWLPLQCVVKFKPYSESPYYELIVFFQCLTLLRLIALPISCVALTLGDQEAQDYIVSALGLVVITELDNFIAGMSIFEGIRCQIARDPDILLYLKYFREHGVLGHYGQSVFIPIVFILIVGYSVLLNYKAYYICSLFTVFAIIVLLWSASAHMVMWNYILGVFQHREERRRSSTFLIPEEAEQET